MMSNRMDMALNRMECAPWYSHVAQLQQFTYTTAMNRTTVRYGTIWAFLYLVGVSPTIFFRLRFPLFSLDTDSLICAVVFPFPRSSPYFTVPISPCRTIKGICWIVLVLESNSFLFSFFSICIFDFCSNITCYLEWLLMYELTKIILSANAWRKNISLNKICPIYQMIIKLHLQ